ncbi:hypothetical protein Mp_7g15270 [Marchantia polymorpha subsp. ruderalis]|uniref:Uncharacterized protein n=2 Tax=Marchantia polymorpha TaxID=3197 RepID=A0AAF6BZU3_MARPO|nr:hypothetical protein MARPO_0009s0211 [Marchantia polymorpha]BBN17527.1 hypothetical protein Mp_7g15270 [Marchantia polymorpha subsp. ruderalis]|eukprot:PTQ47133.1 hypothetical protein MARPO_0009s0211 [Marchantia polymorpha]
MKLRLPLFLLLSACLPACLPRPLDGKSFLTGGCEHCQSDPPPLHSMSLAATDRTVTDCGSNPMVRTCGLGQSFPGDLDASLDRELMTRISHVTILTDDWTAGCDRALISRPRSTSQHEACGAHEISSVVLVLCTRLRVDEAKKEEAIHTEGTIGALLLRSCEIGRRLGRRWPKAQGCVKPATARRTKILGHNLEICGRRKVADEQFAGASPQNSRLAISPLLSLAEFQSEGGV